MIDLSSTILWSSVMYGDEAYLNRVIRVLRYCNRLCKFKKTILFSHLVPREPFEYQLIRMPKLTKDDFNIFINATVPHYLLDGDYSLAVHEDGFILHPTKWDPDFLKWDYIGAPWEDGVVGNGGFCLESRKMLGVKLSLPLDEAKPPIYADNYVCRVNRKLLDAAGIRIAPTDIAERFSTELTGHEKPAFGFHGSAAAPDHYRIGWDVIAHTEKQERLSRKPQVELYYIYVSSAKRANDSPPASYYRPFTERFKETYVRFKPSCPHKLIIVSGGAEPDEYIRNLFKGIDVGFETYMGTGWDIGAHQVITSQSKAGLVVCMNSTVYFHRKGWLERLVSAYQEYGDGLYGPAGSFEAHPHIRAACYAYSPSLIRSYPYQVVNRADSFKFESGTYDPEWNFTLWAKNHNYAVKMVTWDGIYDLPDWRKPENIFRRGDQSNCMVWDRHTDIYACADYQTQLALAGRADGK
jgi:hypothetical protein